MQVPVVQLRSGHVFMEGNLRTLSPAHRFQAIVEGIATGDLEMPPENPKNLPNRDAQFLDWLVKCHEVVGDSAGMGIYVYVHDEAQKDEVFQRRRPEDQSFIDMSWAGRANLLEEPVEFVYDAGLFAGRYTLQPRFIRSNDHKIFIPVTEANRDTRYLDTCAVPILEASVFGSQWQYTWGKFTEISEEDRLPAIMNAYVYTQGIFRDLDDGSPVIDPPFYV
jgi:hypothetical protein